MSAHTMSPRSFLRYLLLPAQPVGLLFIAVLTLGLALCSAVGLFGLPILVILLSWLSKYAYVLLEQVAHGAREPPVLAIEMVNPAADFRRWCSSRSWWSFISACAPCPVTSAPR
jgi:hypothetical protein